MITNIRIFDYSHDVQFKVCAIIMLNATSLTQPPETTHTTRARTHTHTHTHTHTMCCIFHTKMPSRKHNTSCVFSTAFIHWPPPDRPYTHPYTDEPHPSWSSTQKDSSGHCSCLYVYVCSAVCALCSKLPDCFQIRPSWRQCYPIACSCTLL